MTSPNTPHPHHNPLFTACYIEYIYSLYREPCSLASSLPKSTTYSYISQILTSDEAFKITGHLERGTIWVAMVKFHYRNVCVDSPASRNLRKIADQARQHGCAACPHHNITQQLPKHVIINAPRSSLYPFPMPPFHPHIYSAAQKGKQRATKNANEKTSPEAGTHFYPQS